jgi:hypothetical protein
LAVVWEEEASEAADLEAAASGVATGVAWAGGDLAEWEAAAWAAGIAGEVVGGADLRRTLLRDSVRGGRREIPSGVDSSFRRSSELGCALNRARSLPAEG